MSHYKNVSKQLYREAIKKFANNRTIDLPRIATILNSQPDTPEPKHGSVVMPIHLTSTYAQNSPGLPYSKFDYTRGGNPTVDSFEKLMAQTEFGKYCVAFSSGCAAMVGVVSIFNSGDHILCIDDVYGGTNRILRKNFEKFGISNSLVDFTDIENVEKNIKPNTKMIHIETPTNPLLKICDIKRICEIAKERGIITVVDNTFASPIIQSPLLLGADIVLHSGTKYLGGHSDLIFGCLITNSEELNQKLRFNLMSLGGCLGPFEAYLALRSLKTLKLRVEEQSFNAQVITEVLKDHPKIEKLFYPGLPSHKNYDIAQKQMRAPGAMLSFLIKNGNIDNTINFTKNLKYITLAESLGGTKSLVNVPSLMTHLSVPPIERKKLGITDNLIRVSVGSEDVEDLLDDIVFALEHA